MLERFWDRFLIINKPSIKLDSFSGPSTDQREFLKKVLLSVVSYSFLKLLMKGKVRRWVPNWQQPNILPVLSFKLLLFNICKMCNVWQQQYSNILDSSSLRGHSRGCSWWYQVRGGSCCPWTSPVTTSSVHLLKKSQSVQLLKLWA